MNSAVLIASLAPGLLSCSILIANNLRDEKSDRAADKRTLIVRFGRTFGAWEYTLSIWLSGAIPFVLVFGCGKPLLLLSASLVLLVSLPSIQKVFSFRDPLELISVLQNSALVLFLYTALFCVFV